MRNTKLAAVLAAVLILSCLGSIADARTASGTVPKGKRIYDTKFLDINRWHLPFYNDGRFAIDITANNFPGGYWPAPLKNFYLFGGGLWVGAISATNETLVTVGYNPNSGGGEFYPTISAKATEGTGNTKDKVYKYGTDDWPPDRDYFRIEDSDTSLIPKENFSLQDMWMAFTDCYAPQHTSPGVPLGLDVYLTVYAWNYTANQDIFFITYKVKNSTARIPDGPGPTTLKNVYFGVCNDNDIGDATDDMVGAIRDRTFFGTDRVQNVGFVGDNNNTEATGDKWQGGTPGVCALKFLQSPRRGNGDTTQLGMTAFKKFTIDIDPPTNATQYQTMAGIDYQTGIYNAFDSVDETPADKRIIQCSGPFELQPESIATIVVAVFAAPFGPEGKVWATRLNSEEDWKDIVRTAVSAQFIYDRGWLLPGPPESPSITLVPGDNQVRITWDNHSEITPSRYYRVASDPNSQGYDPLYKEYDFQGYKVWKSSDGANWKLLTQCDLVDGDTFRDTTQVESIRTWPTESGIFYSVDDDSVINGFPYYYAVSAYCHNKQTLSWAWDSTQTPPVRYPKDTGDIFLEGGRRGLTIVPRTDPINVDTALAYITKIVGERSASALACTARITIPFKVTAGDTFVFRFLPPQYVNGTKARFRWLATRLDDGSLALDTMGVIYEVTANTLFQNDLPALSGIGTRLRLKMGLPSSPFEAFAVSAGSQYPVDSIRTGANASTGKWAYRGSDYRIVWTKLENGDITARVYDATNQPDLAVIKDPEYNLVPFTNYGSPNTMADSANGWCFVTTALRNATSILDPANSAYLYICGGYVALNKGAGATARPIGSLAALINTGDTWYVTATKPSGPSTRYAGPAYNVFLLCGTPEVAITKPDPKIQLNVRVVPNPYLITNRWETNTWERRIAFNGLPAEADIRIYTLAGDLVKLIHHKATAEQVTGEEAPQKDALGGTEAWDLLTTNRQLIASGVYIYHITSPVGEQVGKFSVIR